MDKILKVPYLTQPTAITCQSTCLKMTAMYFQELFQASLIGAEKAIEQIWEEINYSIERPSPNRNDWVNFVWWLNNNIPDTLFKVNKTRDEVEAVSYIVESINNEYPIIMSTNHTRTKGHIVLIIGYINYTPNQSDEDFRLICHDPYGAFFPELNSKLYGAKRYDTGMTNADGSEEGVGKGVGISTQSIKRNRKDLHSSGEFVMISAN